MFIVHLSIHWVNQDLGITFEKNKNIFPFVTLFIFNIFLILQMVFPLNVTVSGDVTVMVYHARNTLGGVVQGRPTGIKICQLQFHTGFIGLEETSMRLGRNQLDELAEDSSLYAPNFTCLLSFFVSDQDRVAIQPEPWGKILKENRFIRCQFIDLSLFSLGQDLAKTFSRMPQFYSIRAWKSTKSLTLLVISHRNRLKHKRNSHLSHPLRDHLLSPGIPHP